MADFAQIVLATDARGLEQGTQSLDRLAATAERTEQRTDRAMKGVSNDIRGVGAASTVGTHGLRNLGLQLGQVTQQGSVTGNYMQALAIQMPDILMSFGMWGIGLGVVAGALTGIVPALIGATDRVEELDEAVDALALATRDYKRALDDVNFSSIRDDFGSITPELIELRERLAELRLVEMMVAAGESVDALATRFDGFGRSARARIADLFETAQRFADDGGAALAAGFERTVVALDAIRDARGLSEQTSAASRLVDVLADLGFNTADATDEQREFYRQALESENALTMAAAAAGVLGDNVAVAAGNAGLLADNAERALRNLSAANAAENAIGGGGRGVDPRRSPISGAFTYSGPALVQDADGNWIPRESSRGGGGASGAQRQHNEALREAQRIYDATRTSAEAYASEVADLNELLEMGYIDAETHGRALEMLQEQYSEATDAAAGLEEMQGLIKDAILDLAEGGEDAMENLARAIRRAALEALLFGEGPLAGILGGGGNGGGLLSGLLGGLLSLDGGGDTGSGPRTGGLDGKGGFLAMMHPQETVIDRARGQSGGVSEVVVRVDNDGNLQAYVERTSRAAVARQAPRIVQESVRATYAASREVAIG